MSGENLHEATETQRLTGLLRKLGELTGIVPIDDGSGRSLAEQRMIRTFQDSGAKHFRVLRSAETSLRQYTYSEGQRPIPARRPHSPEHP